MKSVTFNWPILLFGVTMVGLVAGYFFTRMASFIPLVALVLYLGVEFNLWQGLVWIFWIFVILSILAIPVGLFRPVRRFIRITGSIALAVAVLAVSFGTWSWDDSRFGDDNEDTKESTTASTSTTIPTTTTTTVPTAVGDVVVNGDSLADGFEDPGDVDPETELAFQEDAVAAMATAEQERGSAAHSEETLETVEELTAWVNDANNPKAVPVRERVVAAITEVCGEEDVAVHLEQNEGWLLMVVRPESQIRGTGYMTMSGPQIATNWRQVGENDAYWLPVCTQGENKGDVAWDGVVRADCANPHETPKIRINRPETPPAPPVDVPPGAPCPYNPALPVDSPECKKPPKNPPPEEPPPGNTPKDPTEDVLVNPDVPEQVRGPGSTEVGEDPGPAEEPTDSPTGCNGPCPAPSTTTTTRPPSSDGGSTTPTTVPGCGGSGQPSCSDTGTSPPTTTAPPAPPPQDQPPQDGMPQSP